MKSKENQTTPDVIPVRPRHTSTYLVSIPENTIVAAYIAEQHLTVLRREDFIGQPLTALAEAAGIASEALETLVLQVMAPADGHDQEAGSPAATGAKRGQLPGRTGQRYAVSAMPLRGTAQHIKFLVFALDTPDRSSGSDLPLRDKSEFPSGALHTAPRLPEEERLWLRTLFAQAPGFMAVVLGPDFIFDVVNDAYQELVGNRELIGRSVREALPEIEGQGYLELLERVYTRGEPYVGRQVPLRVQRFPGEQESYLYVDFLYQPLFGPDGKVIGIFAQGNDVTEFKRAQDALVAANERWKLALEGARDGVWDWDVETNELSVSRRYKEILGFDEDEEGFNRYEEWERLVHPEDLAEIRKAWAASLEGAPFSSEFRLRCKDGSWKWVHSKGLVVHRGDAGQPKRLTGTLSDISEKRESAELIWQHASIDALTGLPNRRLFRDRLNQELRKAHRADGSMALLFIDLDRFKEVNDLLGHDAGDRLLRQVAQRVSACVRDVDTVARLGGDEFTVILTELSGKAHVENVAQKIISTLEEPILLKGEVAYISASIGITVCPQDGTEDEVLIRNADQAMYAAKKAGRGQFCFFTREMQEAARSRVQLLRDLREAVTNDELEVYFQPVVELPSRRISKAEALLRWRHPTKGLIEPSKFILLAEETGLIHRIGDWVFEQAAEWSSRWGARIGKPFEISVNRSPMQFLNKDDGSGWESMLQRTHLPPHSIAVEVTEGVLLNASETVAKAMLRYRDAGVHVALDDFGTGYSSMSYLMKFDIDYLKIDQSFVQDIEHNPGHRTIAESIILMAHRLGIKVIAEGIETEGQAAILEAAGCDYGQGYLFSRPLEPQQFEKMVEVR